MAGKIFEIQHFSVHDGPGIRTTVFLKGCQMKCLWCHNPESIERNQGEFAFVASKCVGCGACFRLCPNGCHQVKDGVHVVDRSKCTFCGKCVRMCAGRALSICGERESEVEDVMEELLADRTYYQESGGGVTLSGGEPLMQADFVRELAARLKAAGIHVTMETNGCYAYERLDGIKENIDLFYIDWKCSDTEKHKEYTGVGNEKIYETIRRLHADGKKVLLRCPIIPGVNDTLDHFRKIAEMTIEMPNLVGAELLPYHSLGVGKIEKFGLEDRIAYMVSEAPSKETLESWVKECLSYGGRIINE